MYSTVILCMMVWIFTLSHGNVNKSTQSSCPVRPTTDLRGPPGIPGRHGRKGEVGEGKKQSKRMKEFSFLSCKEKGI